MARKWRTALRTWAVWTLASAGPVWAQNGQHHLTVDERSSLAWWQINPHLNHLWATTCPEEPNWQPGDDRSSGWAYDKTKAPKTYYAAITDTVVPLYPRPAGQVAPICTPAVRGEVVASDTTSWRGVRGLVAIRAESFISGLTMRDNYAKKAVLQAERYPDIRFRVDSLIEVERGDTLRAKAVGQFELRGISSPMAVPVKAWVEAGGLRVTGKFDIRPTELVERYNVSRMALGLGVGTGVWKTLHLGFDVVLRSPTRAASAHVGGRGISAGLAGAAGKL